MIYIIVDADCDGMTSAAVLINYLCRAWPSAANKIMYNHHPNKAHGIDLALVPENATLVIAPDSSSSDYAIHETLQTKGIDVVVLDHHQAEKVSEYACVVNNQLCDYANKSLSGVGIVYKLCQVFDSFLGKSFADEFLDLVAVGLTADMMDLRNFETHYLIKEGLTRLQNPFLVAIASKNAYSLGDELTPIGVAFYIAPYINAVTRIGTPDEKQLIFEAMLNNKAHDILPSTKRGCKGQEETRVEQAARTCVNIKNRQGRLKESGVEEIENQIIENNLLDHKILIIHSNNLDAGIRGLIANELMSKYQRPTMILAHTTDGFWVGSARGYEKSQLKDFRDFILGSGFAEYSSGHPNAFGVAFTDQNLKNFITWSDDALQDIEFSPSYLVDYIYTSSSVNPVQISEMAGMESLWGQNIDEAYVAIENLSVTKDMITLMAKDRNPTLKIQLPRGVSCIKFKSNEKEFNELYSENGCVTINIVGKCKTDRYNNPQIFIENYEILNKQKYYF